MVGLKQPVIWNVVLDSFRKLKWRWEEVVAWDSELNLKSDKKRLEHPH